MRPGDWPVEDIELMLRKVARGDLPAEGDILTFLPTSKTPGRTQRLGWVFSRLGLREVGFGRFTVDQVTIPSNQTEQYTIIPTPDPPGVPGANEIWDDQVRDIRAGDFVLVGPPENFNSELVYTAIAGQDKIILTINNPDSGQPKKLYDPTTPSGEWTFIALRLIL